MELDVGTKLDATEVASAELIGGTDLGDAELVGGSVRRAQRQCVDVVAEPPSLMPPRSTCLPLNTKYPRKDTKLYSFVEHTPRENSKIHIFSSGS